MASTILIVDDSPTERHVLNDMLTKAGYEVVASDGFDDSPPETSNPVRVVNTPPQITGVSIQPPSANASSPRWFRCSRPAHCAR